MSYLELTLYLPALLVKYDYILVDSITLYCCDSSSIDTIHFRGCETFPPTMRMCDTIIAAVVKRRVNGFPCHFTSVERCGSSWNRE